MSASLDLLPNDVIFRIAILEPIQNIPNLCHSSIRINNLVCNSNNFWREKFIHDLGLPDPDVNILSWKKAYEDYGKVFAFGRNEFGQLGFETKRSTVYFVPTVEKPTLVPNLRLKFMACGYDHTIGIDLDDNVWTFGDNRHGKLGLGDTFANSSVPKQIPNIKAKIVACGSQYTILIDLDNNVWGVGSNTSGQLGLGNMLPFTKTRGQIPNIKAQYVACGGNHTMLIDLDNNVWAFGYNQEGELGLGDNNDRHVPTVLTINGENMQAKFLACGAAHTMIIDMNDNVWAFGYNGEGQLGLGDDQDRNVPTLIPRIKAQSVACGNAHTMIIDLDNNVWAFGFNNNGQLGLIGRFHDNINTPTQLFSMDEETIKAKAVSCDTFHTALIDLNNNVLVFGNNENGQLGLGNVSSAIVPTQLLSSTGEKLRARLVACGGNYTMIILSPSQADHNVKLIPFNEIARKLNAGDFLNFNFLPEYQFIPHNPSNYIATFYGKDGNIYLSELGYNQTTHQILPPK